MPSEPVEGTVFEVTVAEAVDGDRIPVGVGAVTSRCVVAVVAATDDGVDQLGKESAAAGADCAKTEVPCKQANVAIARATFRNNRLIRLAPLGSV